MCVVFLPNTTVTFLQNSCPSEEIIQSNLTKPDYQERQCFQPFSYIFETSVKRLKLLPGELGLGLQLVEALWLVPHHGELQVAFTGVCPGETVKTGERRGRQEEAKVRQKRARTGAGKTKKKKG